MSETNNSQPVGNVLVLSGSASAESAAGQRTLEVGSPVFQNDIIKTADDSNIQIKFIDNTQVSQSENATLNIDSFVYNSDEADNSNLLLNMMKGTFRTISGEIVKDSPTNFMLKTPQSTIGIRGTTVGVQLSEPEGTNTVGKAVISLEEITPGKILVITDSNDVQRILKIPMTAVDLFPGKTISEVRDLLEEEFQIFVDEAPLFITDNPLGYTPADGPGNDVIPSDFGLNGDMMLFSGPGSGLLAIFDSLSDIPGYDPVNTPGQDDDDSNNNFDDDSGDDGSGDDDSGATINALVVQGNWGGEGENTVYVTNAGDVDGDGFDDFIVSSEYADNRYEGEGQVNTYVVYGKANWGSSINVSEMAIREGEADRGVDGDIVRGFDGSPSLTGDVNGDGYNDNVYSEGNVYVDLGGDSDVEITGFGNQIWPTSVNIAGDFNGDGFDDIIIGSPYANADAGESYLIFGQENWPEGIDVSQLDGTDGFTIQGIASGDLTGYSVSGAGDINGDGFDDVIIGSADDAYVIFGTDYTGAVTHAGGTGDDTLDGSDSDDVMIGGLGNDILNGGGGHDVLYGANGDDILSIADDNFFKIKGGSGEDTLRLTGSMNLDLTAIANNKTSGIEKIDLVSDDAANNLTLDASDVLDITDTTNELFIDRGRNDRVDRGDDFTYSGTESGYDIYTSDSGATLHMTAFQDAVSEQSFG